MRLDEYEREIAQLGQRAGATPATIARVLQSRRKVFADAAETVTAQPVVSGADSDGDDGHTMGHTK